MTLHLGSNNPFRKPATSPKTSPYEKSTNPFLDNYQPPDRLTPRVRRKSPEKENARPEARLERPRSSDERRPRTTEQRLERPERAERADKERPDRPSKADTSERRRPRKNRQVDLIDKLDVTGIFGGGMFHHDGPFDACNPHRNRKGSKAAPLRAFAEDSVNNTIGGSGPVNKDLDFDRIHGRGAEGFSDYNTIQAEALAQPAGLGVSTFLEGTAAPRSAMQRQQSDVGLQRKKSLVQRIRGRRDNSPPPPVTQSAGGLPGMNENNPFFEDADQAAFTVTRARTASSPRRGLLRRMTNEEEPKGLLNRVKSLSRKK